jgi:hypothetical protein
LKRIGVCRDCGKYTHLNAGERCPDCAEDAENPDLPWPVGVPCLVVPVALVLLYSALYGLLRMAWR